MGFQLSSLYSGDVSVNEDIGLLGIQIDRGAELPIGVQLAWALRARIADGQLAAGQRLPGLRELAEALQINVNTVRAVYQRLEREGLIDSRQGTGTFVAHAALERSAVGQIAAQAARQARDTGVDPRAVAAALYVSAEPPNSEAEAEAERRRELREQIAALERTLSELHSEHHKPFSVNDRPMDYLPKLARAPRLPNVQELEEIRADLVAQLASFDTPTTDDDSTGTAEESTSAAAAAAAARSPTAKRAPSIQTRPPRPRPSTA